MAPIAIRQHANADNSVTEWTTGSLDTFIERVLERAQAVRAQAPFLVPRTFTEEDALSAGITALEGAHGAMVLLDDGSMRFIEAPDGHIITTGSGELVEDTTSSRAELCRQWLARATDCAIDVREYTAATDDVLTAWKAAEAAQAKALAAAVEEQAKGKLRPKTLKLLQKACDERDAAFRELPPWPTPET